MKKTAENRYPHSATLFKFCKEALELRYEGNVKVIDQDVGAILGYDPADCSHWKKGKKNIRSLSTLRSIADHLNIDERLLIDITAGKIDLEEALFEYKGYGQFAILGSSLENLKKEYFKNPSKWQTGSNVKTFEELFDIDQNNIIFLAENILKLGRFQEAPLYIPEVFALFPNITCACEPSLDQAFRVEKEGSQKQARVRILYKEVDMRPFIRFLAAKELFLFLIETEHELAKFLQKAPSEVMDVQSNVFSEFLLVPTIWLKNEVKRIDGSFDLVGQLANTFWVSKALMNRRLTDSAS